MRSWFGKRPWIWILLLIGFLLSLSAAFVSIALRQAPILADEPLPEHQLADPKVPH